MYARAEASILLHHAARRHHVMHRGEELAASQHFQVTAAWLVCFPISYEGFAHLTAYCAFDAGILARPCLVVILSA